MTSVLILARWQRTFDRAGLKIRKWGEGSIRSYYKPKQMKNLYDVETSVKKDVVIFRYEDPKKIIGRAWIGLACIPFGLYMSQTSLMLKPTLEGWQDREFDSRTSYLMGNIQAVSKGLGVFWLIFLPVLGIYYFNRTRHTVRKLVLRKGGKMLSIRTYGVTPNGGRWIHVPSGDCEASQRAFFGGYKCLLNVKDHKFAYHFNLEEGVINNRGMFDRAIGLGRRRL